MSSSSFSSKSSADAEKNNNINVTELDPEKYKLETQKSATVLETIISPNGKEVEIGTDDKLDDAMKLAAEAKEIEVTPEQDRKLVWKIDICMFPLMCLIYAVQFMDKVATGSAAIMGLRTDLKMHGDQYSWVGSSFYFGYLFMNLGPVQFLFQKSKYMSKMLGIFIVLWGMLLCCHSSPHINYPGFIVLRVLLGCVESVVTPCFTIITAQYWKADEQFTRIAIWFAMNGLGVIFLNSMAYGLFIHKDSYTIEAWRVLFIVIGVITLFLGAMIYYWIPDVPSNARFLTKDEKLMVVQRIRSNQQGFGNHKIKKYQIIEALRDPRTWLYFFMTVTCNIPNGGITNFFNILLQGDFGYSTKDSLLMAMPTGAIELVGCSLFGILAYYCGKNKVPIWRYRLTWAIFTAVLSLVSSCMLAYAKDNKSARLAGAYLWYITPIALICVYSNISANSSGYTKKWTVSSINQVGYAAANIAGPQCFVAKQAPGYQGAKTAMVVCYAVEIAILTAILVINIRENKKRDKLAEERGTQEVEHLEFTDMTDFENPNFRYTL
ncbi:Allantoate permease [Monosporozyma unispora]|nr:Allantoate permease [Kazachstania unispora]